MDKRVDDQRTNPTDEHDDVQPRDAYALAFDLNTQTLSQLISEFRALRETVLESRQVVVSRSEPAIGGESMGTVEELAEAESHRGELEQQNAELRVHLERLQQELQELRDQNDDLASRVANSQLRKSVATRDSSSDDALSWEERKAMILQQMEDESFDVESLVAEIASSPMGHDDSDGSAPMVDPVEHVRQLHQRLALNDSELKRRDQEIGELRCLLEQQSSNTDSGVAFGAAAIAQMIDGDELVREEREKLQRLQEEWEEKFRRSEVAASLERAKLSRERQELAQKKAELEDQLAQLRHAKRDPDVEGRAPSRRWLAALGLHESKD